MLKEAKARTMKFYEENRTYCGFVAGVVLMTAVSTTIDVLFDRQYEKHGFKNVRLFKDSETGDIIAEDIYGQKFKAEFPEDV